MSTITVPAAPSSHADRSRWVPWRNFVWVTWRQHRLALLGLAAMLAVLSLWMLVEGLRVRSAIAAVGLAGCRTVQSRVCGTAFQAFDSEGYQNSGNVFAGILQILPILIGVFIGTPILAREIESGTFRFAWTQGAGRRRWIVAKLVMLGALVTLGAAALTPLIGWYAKPFVQYVGLARIRPLLFDLSGVDYAAWTLVAFAIGALAGVLVKRMVAAMAAAAAATVGLALATVLFLRRHYEAPIASKTSIKVPEHFPGGPPWVLRNWWTGPDGHPVSDARLVHLIQNQPTLSLPVPKGQAQGPDPMTWLASHGYLHWISYQPATRYWLFQGIEGAWLLVLALLLGAATVWLVRRGVG